MAVGAGAIGGGLNTAERSIDNDRQQRRRTRDLLGPENKTERRRKLLRLAGTSNVAAGVAGLGLVFSNPLVLTAAGVAATAGFLDYLRLRSKL